MFCGFQVLAKCVLVQEGGNTWASCSLWTCSLTISNLQVMAELFGKKTGCCRGQGGSMHMFSAKHGVLGGYAFIGEGIPIGVGAAFQSAYK